MIWQRLKNWLKPPVSTREFVSWTSSQTCPRCGKIAVSFRRYVDGRTECVTCAEQAKSSG